MGGRKIVLVLSGNVIRDGWLSTGDEELCRLNSGSWHLGTISHLGPSARSGPVPPSAVSSWPPSLCALTESLIGLSRGVSSWFISSLWHLAAMATIFPEGSVLTSPSRANPVTGSEQRREVQSQLPLPLKHSGLPNPFSPLEASQKMWTCSHRQHKNAWILMGSWSVCSFFWWLFCLWASIRRANGFTRPFLGIFKLKALKR